MAGFNGHKNNTKVGKKAKQAERTYNTAWDNLKLRLKCKDLSYSFQVIDSLLNIEPDEDIRTGLITLRTKLSKGSMTCEGGVLFIQNVLKK